MLSLHPDGELDAVVEKMNRALENVHTGEITVAVRNVEIDNVNVKEGQVIALLDGKLVASAGSVQEASLELPREVLISVMKKHQRYFPLEKDGRLLPRFIVVRYGDTRQLDLVREGNEHVVRARFADAAFFVREDVKRPLADFRADLAKITFQKKLGSMLTRRSGLSATGAIAKRGA
jgi:glycyl-tRNA synthetase beta subunit